MQFPSYQSLYQHVQDHRDHSMGILLLTFLSLEEVLNNQMIISSTSYYCPIQGCEVIFQFNFYYSLVMEGNHYHFLYYNVILEYDLN